MIYERYLWTPDRVVVGFLFMKILRRHTFVVGLLALAISGCGRSDSTPATGMMEEADHSHYHVHAVDASHGHDHSGDNALNGHSHQHEHPHKQPDKELHL
jgi:hypothetical protein